MNRGKRKSPLEKKIQADIEADLGAERDLLLLRNSVGEAVYISEETAKEWHVPYGLGVGSPDLVSILKAPWGLGCWLCLEVKQPGKDAEPEQEKCHRIWRRFGALVYVVHSVAEARGALKHARAALREVRVSA